MSRLLSRLSPFAGLLVAGASTLSAQTASDDVIYVASWQETRISIELLLANDGAPAGTPWQILEAPESVAVEGDFLIHSTELHWGIETLR
ncbi:MAG: hypothetical protein MI919_43020, partial [Holophagales bacterium]|nr:hypothetical protein [Holophagales bacterium]